MCRGDNGLFRLTPRSATMTFLPGANHMARRNPIVLMTICLTFAIAQHALAAEPLTKPAKITLDESGVLVVDGKKIFPINLTVVPGPDAKAPSGRPAYAEFADAGVFSMRSGGGSFDLEKEKAMPA